MTDTTIHYVPPLDRRNRVPDIAALVPEDFFQAVKRAEPGSRPVASTAEDGQTWVPAMGLAGLGLMLLWMFLAVVGVSLAMDIVGMFCGLAIYSLANYIGHRFGQAVWLGPMLSAKLFYASVALACTAAAAGLTM